MDWNTFANNFANDFNSIRSGVVTAANIKFIIAIIVPAVLFAWIMTCMIICCVCCRPTNEAILRYHNAMIDPLEGIDTKKLRHWVYIRNNIQGSDSGQTALMAMTLPQTMIIQN